MKPHHILKTWFGMDFVFPHWALYWLFWFSLVMIPVPMSFAHHSGPISYRTGLFLGTYFTLITFFLAMLASYIGYKYTQSKGRTVPDYQNKRYRVMGAMLGTGPFILYFTGYLITIPFGHAPNYVFTLKPSPQLEMELNHLLGDDTIEYTPFDYSLDEQEVTYVTNGIDSMFFDIIARPRKYPEKIVTLTKGDLAYTSAINKHRPFDFKVINGHCYISTPVESFTPRVIDHPKFESPITISIGKEGEMLVDANGAYNVRFNACGDRYSVGSDFFKRYALEAYLQYPHIYKSNLKHIKVYRPTITLTLEHFDEHISNF
ncbi:hypothetical protein [Alkalimarinus coralli]|uniref:hypothetical protein n=1 Tax=Alkalimarinus coralli TaxID=2935863 RepID=UPI00202B1840|nr:hypothetical protein [Alkalimarinus coralli]